MAVGCDVSKKRVDVFVLGDDVQQSFAVSNERRALETFARRLPAGSKVGMEATSTYHELLADILHEAGHTVYVINARWIKAYRKGVGMRGKSDRTDAQVIARYVHAEHRALHVHVPLTPEQRELRTLLQRRAAIGQMQASTRQSLGDEAAPILKELKALARKLERRIVALIRLHPQWNELELRLRTLPGIGLQGAARLVAELTRHPFANVDAFVAHTGTDPRPNDSGQKRGRRHHTHHGNASLRRLLYMAAMTAIRMPQWQAIYEAARARGLSSTAALVIIGRKIARIAFSLYQTGQSYDPSRLAHQIA